MTAYRYPDSHVFYRKLSRSYPRIVRGEGSWLYDEQGKDYLDAVGGARIVLALFELASIGVIGARRAGCVGRHCSAAVEAGGQSAWG